MDEDEIYRQLEALKDRQDAKLPGIGAESDPLYHELDFRVQYELAIRSTRGPHVKDVHEHVLRALGDALRDPFDEQLYARGVALFTERVRDVRRPVGRDEVDGAHLGGQT
mgnify:CR=1 FL=1